MKNKLIFLIAVFAALTVGLTLLTSRITRGQDPLWLNQAFGLTAASYAAFTCTILLLIHTFQRQRTWKRMRQTSLYGAFGLALFNAINLIFFDTIEGAANLTGVAVGTAISLLMGRYVYPRKKSETQEQQQRA